MITTSSSTTRHNESFSFLRYVTLRYVTTPLSVVGGCCRLLIILSAAAVSVSITVRTRSDRARFSRADVRLVSSVPLRFRSSNKSGCFSTNYDDDGDGDDDDARQQSVLVVGVFCGTVHILVSIRELCYRALD
eukprot:jgi/Psemu1/303813/fgenesh1_kg.124_\